MKFKDPLASLYHLGGTLSNHAAMGFFAGFTYFYHRNQIECEDVTNEDLYLEFRCVYFMFLAHSAYAVLFVIQKSLSKTSDSGTYTKTFCIFLSMFLYFIAYLYIQFWGFTGYSMEIQTCIANSDQNS